MKFSHSMLHTYLECPASFYWKYVQNIEPAKKSADLDYGTVLHEMMATYFQTGNYSKALDILKQRYIELDIASNLCTQNKAKTIATGEFLLQEVIKLNLTKNINTVFVEEMVERNLPSGLTYRGKIDLAIFNNLIIDFKSTSRKDIAFSLFQWELSRQFKGYCWLRGTTEVQVVILNALMQPDVLVHSIIHTQEEIDLWVEETDSICIEINRKLNTLQEQKQKANRVFPRATTRCQIFPCSFFSVCLQGRLENAIIDPSRFIHRKVI